MKGHSPKHGPTTSSHDKIGKRTTAPAGRDGGQLRGPTNALLPPHHVTCMMYDVHTYSGSFGSS